MKYSNDKWKSRELRETMSKHLTLNVSQFYGDDYPTAPFTREACQLPFRCFLPNKTVFREVIRGPKHTSLHKQSESERRSWELRLIKHDVISGTKRMTSHKNLSGPRERAKKKSLKQNIISQLYAENVECLGPEAVKRKILSPGIWLISFESLRGKVSSANVKSFSISELSQTF